MTFYPSQVDDIVLCCLIKGSNGVKHQLRLYKILSDCLQGSLTV